MEEEKFEYIEEDISFSGMKTLSDQEFFHKNTIKSAFSPQQTLSSMEDVDIGHVNFAISEQVKIQQVLAEIGLDQIEEEKIVESVEEIRSSKEPVLMPMTKSVISSNMLSVMIIDD